MAVVQDRLAVKFFLEKGAFMAEQHLFSLAFVNLGHAGPTSFQENACLLYTSPSPRDRTRSRMPSSA